MSMTTQETVTALLERLQAGDAHGAGELFAEEIDWYVPGEPHLPWAGRRTQREQVAEFFTHLESECVPGESDVTLERVLIDGDHAVVFGTFHRRFTKTGRSFDNPEAMHLQVIGGQIVRMHLYEDTAMVIDAWLDT
jgi:ketosteroid isomerase-like protein